MSKTSNARADADELRVRATSKLTGGNATHARASSFDALAVLHRLATSPATADSALALLHELQVHQVELDMQAEELRESRIELESALHWHMERYDLQPVACFTLNGDCIVQEMNLPAAAMLDIERDQGVGQALDGFLVPASGSALRGLLSDIGKGHGNARATLELVAGSNGARAVRADVSGVPSRKLFLVVLSHLSD